MNKIISIIMLVGLSACSSSQPVVKSPKQQAHTPESHQQILLAKAAECEQKNGVVVYTSDTVVCIVRKATIPLQFR